MNDGPFMVHKRTRTCPFVPHGLGAFLQVRRPYRTVPDGFLRLSRSQVQVLPGARSPGRGTYRSGGHELVTPRWSTNGPHSNSVEQPLLIAGAHVLTSDTTSREAGRHQMATRPGHPSTHGHHINRWTCGSHEPGGHRACDGFSGGYDTYVCGCCCHDLNTDPKSVSDEDRAWIERVTAPLSKS